MRVGTAGASSPACCTPTPTREMHWQACHCDASSCVPLAAMPQVAWQGLCQRGGMWCPRQPRQSQDTSGSFSVETQRFSCNNVLLMCMVVVCGAAAVGMQVEPVGGQLLSRGRAVKR